MVEQIVIAGFGGQGVMSMGQLLTYAGMLEDKNVSWLPSYGPEMRGGTANCSVIVSDQLVGSPIVTEANTAIVMNRPSLAKFQKIVIEGGLLLINSSLIKDKTDRQDLKVYEIPANEIANEIGNVKAANMVMLGAYLELTKLIKTQTVIEAFKKVFGPTKEHLIPLNKLALERGAEYVRK